MAQKNIQKILIYDIGVPPRQMNKIEDTLKKLGRSYDLATPSDLEKYLSGKKYSSVIDTSDLPVFHHKKQRKLLWDNLKKFSLKDIKIIRPKNYRSMHREIASEIAISRIPKNI